MTSSGTPTRRASLWRAAVVTIGGFVLLGLLAGWLWYVLAEPAAYTVTSRGAVMGEGEAAQQFGVDVTFGWIGAVAGGGWGALCAWWYARLGWSHVLLTLAGAVAASALAWRLGHALGPPEPRAVVRSAEAGTQVAMQVQVGAYGVLLFWPIAALLGLLVVVTWFTRDDSQSWPT